MRGLDRFRIPAPSPALGSRLVSLLAMVLLGAAAGVVAKRADFSSQLLGNIFSELPIWILFGLLIARFSGSPVRCGGAAPPEYPGSGSGGGVCHPGVWVQSP